jgi:hypothetical protein
MTEYVNPPWSEKAIRKSWDGLQLKLVSLGVPPEWMPVEPLQELGCGHYGCVYSTSDPKIVFKVTTDATESVFVANYLKLREQNVYSLGVVQYYGIVGLNFKHRGRPMFAIWREEVSLTGCPSVEDSLHKMWDIKGYAHWAQVGQYEHREWNDFVKQLRNFKGYAHWARTISVEKRRRYDEDAYWNWMDDQIRHARDTDDPSEGEVMRAKTSGSRYPYKFGLFVRMCEMMSQEMGSSYFGVNVGNALETYLDAGLLLADVHCGNIGMYVGEEIDLRQSYAPIITDPGHSVVLKRELDNPEIDIV